MLSVCTFFRHHSLMSSISTVFSVFISCLVHLWFQTPRSSLTVISVMRKMVWFCYFCTPNALNKLKNIEAMTLLVATPGECDYIKRQMTLNNYSQCTNHSWVYSWAMASTNQSLAAANCALLTFACIAVSQKIFVVQLILHQCVYLSR